VAKMTPYEVPGSGLEIWRGGREERDLGKKYNVSIDKDPKIISGLEAFLKNEKLNSCLFFMLQVLFLPF
jgi:hypothetical protein